MKTHAIIPIFIPHRGCPHDCVFCNQRRITAHTDPVTPEAAADIIDTWLTTLSDVPTVEVAFYGGSFTALPMDEQSAYLAVARSYMDKALIDGIHLSTRPDCIDRPILDNLKAYGVETIELGVQSFDDNVLRRSGRGHDSACVYTACRLIREYGFRLGIQLMIGLPGDSMDACLYSAAETVRIAPEIARLYPTVVLPDTALYDMCESGAYRALSLEEATERTAAMYRLLTAAGIRVIRVGLKSSDLLNEKSATLGDTFHPAFRQLVEGRIAREDICAQLDEMLGSETPGVAAAGDHAAVLCSAGTRSFSALIGHRACNRAFFAAHYPGIAFRFRPDPNLPDGTYTITPCSQVRSTD